MKKIIILILCGLISCPSFAGGIWGDLRKFPINGWKRAWELPDRAIRKLNQLMGKRYRYTYRQVTPPSTPAKPGFPGTMPETIPPSVQRYIPRTIVGDKNVKVLSYNQPVLADERIQELHDLVQRSQGARSVLMYDSAKHNPLFSELDQLVLFSYRLYQQGRLSPILQHFRYRRLNNELEELVADVTAPIAVLDIADGAIFTLHKGNQIAVSDKVIEVIETTSLPEGTTWTQADMSLPQLEEIALRSTEGRSFLMPQELEELLISGQFGQPRAGIYEGGYTALMVQLPQELTVFDGQKLITLETGSYLQLPLAELFEGTLEGNAFPLEEAHIYNITPEYRVVEDFALPQQFLSGNTEGIPL